MLLYAQQGEDTDRPLVAADDVPRGRERRGEMGMFVSDAIVSFVYTWYRVGALSIVRVRVVLLCVLTPSLLALVLDKALLLCGLWSVLKHLNV